MDATMSATYTAAQQQLKMPFLANATVYAIGDCTGDGCGGGADGDACCCKSNVNDTTNDAADEPVLFLLPRSNAALATVEAPASVGRESADLGEDSHFDSSSSGAHQLPLQSQHNQSPQFSDFSDGATAGPTCSDVKDQMELAVPHENCEGTQPNQASAAEEAEVVATERLLFITALASAGEAPAAAAMTASTTTTTTTTTTKKWPLEIVEAAENHNTRATVVGDHGAPTNNGTATVSADSSQQFVYVSSATTTSATSAQVRCSSHPNSNVVRIQIIPGATSKLGIGNQTAEELNQNSVRGVGRYPPSDLQSTSVSVSSSPAAGSKCLSSTVTVVSFGSDGSASGSSVVFGERPHEHQLAAPEPRTERAAAVAKEIVPDEQHYPTKIAEDSDVNQNSNGIVEHLNSGVSVTVASEDTENERTLTSSSWPVVVTSHDTLEASLTLSSISTHPVHTADLATACTVDGRTGAGGGEGVTCGDGIPSIKNQSENESSQELAPTATIEDERQLELEKTCHELATLTDMVQKKAMVLSTGGAGTAAELDNSAYVYYMATAMPVNTRPSSTGGGSSSSGQCSPSDMLDSGTCSDIEVAPPPLPKKMSQMFKSSSSSSTASTAAAALTLAIKNSSTNGAEAQQRCDKTAEAVINQQSVETQELHHHHHEFHSLHLNQTHQQQQEQQHHLLNEDEHHHEEKQNRQNGKHQTHVDLTQNCFEARQQQQLASTILTDSDGSESCLSCDSLNFEHLSSLQPLVEVGVDPAALVATAGPDLLSDGVISVELAHLAESSPITVTSFCQLPAKTGDEFGLNPGAGERAETERAKERGPKVPPFPAVGERAASNVCSLPDSLLAAIRESRPKVYCTNDDEDLPPLHFEAVATRNGARGAPSMIEQLELMMPTTTTRSILMDKINSLEQSAQGRAARAFSDQPEQDASSNYFHQNNLAINSDLSVSALPARAQSSCSAGSVTTESVRSNHFESDKFYKFHIHERRGADGSSGDPSSSSPEPTPSMVDDDESFAGLKDLSNGTSTIRSNKGTVRGVKNRVRNGIATFLQMQQVGMKNYKDKEAGKVVVYSTSMGIVRETYTKCMNVKQILRTLLIKFEEKDIFMSNEYQQEIKERMQTDTISIPQVFVDGQHIGDAQCIERLNETGELRKMLKPYKCLESPYMCKVCGGYRLLPCPSCGGSKKSIHRNHFTAEFIALKCMNCDEVGLVKCHNC